MRKQKLKLLGILLVTGLVAGCDQSKVPKVSDQTTMVDKVETTKKVGVSKTHYNKEFRENTNDTELNRPVSEGDYLVTSNLNELTVAEKKDTISPLNILHAQILLNKKDDLLFKSDKNLILVQKSNSGAEDKILFYNQEAQLIKDINILSLEPYNFFEKSKIREKEGSHYFLEFEENGEEILSQVFSKTELSSLYTDKAYYYRSIYFHNGFTVLLFSICPTVRSNEEYEPYSCKKSHFVFDLNGNLVQEFLLPLNIEYYPNEYSKNKYAGGLYADKNDFSRNCFAVSDINSEKIIYNYCNDQEVFILGPTFLSKDLFFVFSRSPAKYYKSHSDKRSTVFVCRLIDIGKKVEYKKILDFTLMPERLSGDNFFYRTGGNVFSFSLNKDFFASSLTF